MSDDYDRQSRHKTERIPLVNNVNYNLEEPMVKFSKISIFLLVPFKLKVLGGANTHLGKTNRLITF